MSKEENVSAVTDPDNAQVIQDNAQVIQDNAQVIQPPYAEASGSQKKPLERTTSQTSATMPRYTKSGKLRRPHVVIQDPAEMTGLQAQPTGLQYSGQMAGVQAQPGGIQCPPEITTVQVLAGDPQNPLNTAPGPTETSSHPQWSTSSLPCPGFNPKKFINEEIRTLGGIQIIIGLFHIVSAVNPELYRNTTVLGVSGYLVWGGISFIISGFLSIWVEKDPSSCMVSINIGTNVISSIFSLFGIIIITVDLCISQSDFKSLTGCLKAISGGLLPFALLEFIITCVISRFGCPAACLTHCENMTTDSAMFSGDTVNKSNGPIYMTNGPVYTTGRPVYMTDEPVYMTDGPVNMTNGPVNTTDGPVNMTNGPDNTTSPDSATNIPSNAPPGHSYKDRADLDQG